MKILGLLMLFSGWGLVLSALALLRTPTARAGFVAIAIAIELLGLFLLFRGHMPVSGDRR
jgi:hypothetical protein